VFVYDFDSAEGAIVFDEDETCPFICIEHAIDNERHAIGERRLHGRVSYPYTNRHGMRGLTVYRQQEPAYIARGHVTEPDASAPADGFGCCGREAQRPACSPPARSAGSRTRRT
jgi:hypothetical protein